MFLIGNQKDKEKDRAVSKEEADKFRKEKGIHFFFETSAKTGENVESIFIMASKMLYNNFKDKIAQMVRFFKFKLDNRKRKHQQRKEELSLEDKEVKVHLLNPKSVVDLIFNKLRQCIYTTNVLIF